MRKDDDEPSKEDEEALRDAEARRLHALRTEALSEGPGRNALYEKHPLVRNKLRMITPPIKKVYSVVEQVIVHHDPGTCFAGAFRMGKSLGLESVRAECARTFPDIPSHILIAKDHLDPNEAEFYGDILEDYRHGGARSGRAGERKKKIFARWEAEARSKASDRYLLFVDEAENWKEQELIWLRDMTNVMEKRNVEIQTLMFGDTALLLRRAELLEQRRTDLIGRFLLSLHEFHGHQGPEDLTETFALLDNAEKYDFPSGSGIAMSQFFLPRAFQNGWRMASEAPTCWAEFVEVASRKGSAAKNVGMQWVMRAIRNFLFAHVSKDSAVFMGTHEEWLLAVEASGFENSLDGDQRDE